MSTRLVFFGFLLWIAAAAFPALTQNAFAQRSSSKKDSNEKALAIYADAAEFQNNGAFELAVEEWNKLLQEYPKDPLASKASHYLGVSHIQLQQYDKAIQALQFALQDRKLDIREETRINLGWCLFTQARAAEPNSRSQKQGFAAARDAFREFLKAYPKSSFLDQALFYLGEIEYTGGETRKSIGYYKQLLDNARFKSSPLRADARYAIAVAYEEERDLRNARSNYRAFLDNHGDHRLAQEVSVRLADLLLAENDAAGAEQVLDKLAGQGEMADYSLLRLGYALSKLGKSQESNAKYVELLERFPNSPHVAAAAISVGQSLYREGKYDAAIQRFEQATSKKDAVAEDAVHWIAITYNRQNKFSEAKELLEEALGWAKDSATLKMDYADALYNTPNEMDKATAAYELIAKNHGDHPLAPRAAYNAAFAALQMRDFEKARQWSQWFLDRFPQDPLRNDVAYVAAETLLQDGEYKSAAKAYEQLLRSSPSNPSANLWVIRQGMANYLDGQYEQAIRVIQPSIRNIQAPQQKAEALFILGASSHYQEKYSQAISQLESSREASRNWESADEVLLLLSEAQQRSSDIQSAIQSLKTLLAEYPSSRLRAQAEYKLGQLSASSGDYDDAIQRYEAILEIQGANNLKDFAQYGVAWCLMQKEQYAAALPQLEAVLERLNGGALANEARLAKGVCLRKQNRVEEAIRTLNAFLDSDPSGVSLGNGLYELGLAYTDTKQLEKANALFLRLLKEVPEYPSKEKVLYELAWNYQDSEDAGSASKYFAQLASDFPKSEFGGEAMYMMAQRLYDKERFAEAAELYRKALEQGSASDLREKSIYKYGWSMFQQEMYSQASDAFRQQVKNFPNGALAIDAAFMTAECEFEQDQYEKALSGYRVARQKLESARNRESTAAQVQELIYLHGGQCLREQKQWRECEEWLSVILKRYPKSTYLPTALYEMGFCKQQQNQLEEALKLYTNVAENYRTEVGARARFMMGEIFFGKRQFDKAIPEFQRVMFGFGGDKAPEGIKNWQAKSAFEAARCSEILIDSLGGAARKKVIETAQEFYAFILEKHSKHELSAQARARLGDLQKLR